ncbi:TPM domain-containing protein [Candidatus Thorarchaeota archaeon]|nr:MAG: TPM domain-containing protein [Candidatus Thorarchaeota archaeon]
MESDRQLISFLLLAALAISVTLCIIPEGQGLPEPTGYMVNDWAYLLTWEEDDSLEDLCRAIEDETTVEVYVVTTTDLEGYDLNEYSYRLFNDWGIGKEDVNNGLLLTLHYVDINSTHFSYEFRIEVGRGLESAITDSEAGRIGRDNISVWFDWAYFYDGFYEGILELYNEFKDDPSVVSSEGVLGGFAALQAWAYANPLLAGVFIGVGLWFAGVMAQAGLLSGRRIVVPLALMVGLVAFAWWLDGSLLVLFYSVAIAVGATVTVRGAGRIRSGGGRTEGGGWRT